MYELWGTRFWTSKCWKTVVQYKECSLSNQDVSILATALNTTDKKLFYLGILTCQCYLLASIRCNTVPRLATSSFLIGLYSWETSLWDVGFCDPLAKRWPQIGEPHVIADWRCGTVCREIPLCFHGDRESTAAAESSRTRDLKRNIDAQSVCPWKQNKVQITTQ